MALTSTPQSDWGGGMFRQRISPPAGAYDLGNMLIGDDSFPFKRGGSAFYSAADAGTALLQVYDAYLQAGQRTVALAASNLYALNGTTPVSVFSTFSNGPTTGRSIGTSGMLVIPTTTGVGFYGGSLKTTNYFAGTATVTNGSKTITGAGTLWAANVDAGMMFTIASSDNYAVVATVDSDTQLTLRDAWPFATVAAGVYILSAVAVPTRYANLGTDPHLAAVGPTPRLVVTAKNRAYYTPRGQPFSLTAATDFIELPDGTLILGAQGIGTTTLLFTTDGVWAISDMELDAVDSFGNIQWGQHQINGDFALWGEAGISSYDGRLIVPALNDIFQFSPGGGVDSITMWSIRALYRSYVKAGYTPGVAATFRGHYFLPILSGSTVIDVLVARLDRPHLLSARPRIWMFPWTRFSGHAAGAAYAVRPNPNSGAGPKLLSISAQRITDLTNIFDPTSANALEADGTAHTATVESNDLPTGGQWPGFIKRVRATYVLTAASSSPTVAMAISSDEEAGAYTTLTDSGLQKGGTAGQPSDGTKYSWWNVGGRAGGRVRARFKLTQTGACASFVLRSFSMFTRGSGKQ